MFCLIPLAVQKEILGNLETERYIKTPPKGTNPRGVELSAEALKCMLQHSATMKLNIYWDKTLSRHTCYDRWLNLWGKEHF